MSTHLIVKLGLTPGDIIIQENGHKRRFLGAYEGPNYAGRGSIQVAYEAIEPRRVRQLPGGSGVCLPRLNGGPAVP